MVGELSRRMEDIPDSFLRKVRQEFCELESIILSVGLGVGGGAVLIDHHGDGLQVSDSHLPLKATACELLTI